MDWNPHEDQAHVPGTQFDAIAPHSYGAGRLKRRRFHRATFVAAGAYNIVWGCYAVLEPQWFFRLTGLPLSNSPQIFATLGMVLGLYGLLYLEVARRPEHGWPAAAVGLTGKVLGPLGLAWLIATGEWPIGTVVIVITNDLVWWVPFAWYLLDGWPHFRATWQPTSRH